MKLITRIRTVVICAVFLGIFGITFAVTALAVYTPAGMENYAVVQYLLKNLSIQANISDDYWMNTYPYDHTAAELFQMKIREIEKAFESVCTISFPESEKVNDCCKFLKENIYHYKISEIMDKSENIHYVQKHIDNVIEFSQVLKTEGYPFLYVRTPLPGSLNYQADEGASVEMRMYPERAEALTEALVRSGIDVVDFSKDTQHTYTFDCTSHWFPKDALYAAGVIAQKLNEQYNFAYDADDFCDDNYRSFMVQYPEVSEEISRINGYFFDIPIPVAKTKFTVRYAEEEQWSGNFTESFIRPEELWRMEDIAYHNMFRISNTLIHEIHNDNAMTNSEKHILVLSDSYDWPLASYLAMGTGKVTLLHNSSFTGSILSYIRSVQPDMVIIAYNDIQYEDIYTEDAFYLK